MPAELFNFPPRPGRDGDVPPDVVRLLRVMAKQAAETGADPAAVVTGDHELLLVCDTLLLLKRAADDAEAAFYRTDSGNPRYHEVKAEMLRMRRACVQAMRCAAKLRASTPSGLFAKAAAVKRAGSGAADLCVSLAGDLLASAELRALIWPTAER